jgi:hypothetical protein
LAWRSTFYYQPRPESTENLRLLRRMAVTLEVNRKRIHWLMRIPASKL